MFVTVSIRSRSSGTIGVRKQVDLIRLLYTNSKTVCAPMITKQPIHRFHPNNANTKASFQKLFKINEQYLTTTSKDVDEEASKDKQLIYEGPFRELTLTLKRISVTTCAIGFVGIPMIVYAQGLSSSMSLTAQIAVAGTTMLAACGSTVALSFCFSPYVHSLTYVDDERKDNDGSQTSSTVTAIEEENSFAEEENKLLQAITCNILGMKVKTIFNPSIDITSPNKRPFCNFIAKGMPMYIHPQLMEDEKLRRQFFGDAADTLPKKTDEMRKEEKEEKKDKNSKKDDDDGFIF